MILISIIIATYNAGKDLQACLDSIISQKKNYIEIIIIDGNSSDNTKEIIKRNENIIRYWVSEPDKGIYDAWNKGISQAKGSWIMFLGADDQLLHGSLDIYKKAISELKNADNIDLISAKMQMVDKYNRPKRIKGSHFEWPLFLKKMTIAHPGALHSSQLFKKIGKYNTDYRIVGDYELLLRAGASLNTIFINEITVLMKEGGVSDNSSALKEHYLAVISTTNYSKLRAKKDFVVSYIKFQIRKHIPFITSIFIKKATNNEDSIHITKQ